MSWSLVTFGKHKGKTLPQIIFADLDWFFWAVENGVFANKGALNREAADIDGKARNIRPSQGRGEWVVKYIVHVPSEKFLSFSTVPANQTYDEGSGHIFYEDVIDLSFPRRISRYDKLGSKYMVDSLKFCIFGTRRVCTSRAE